jgi:hypothetical protein
MVPGVLSCWIMQGLAACSLDFRPGGDWIGNTDGYYRADRGQNEMAGYALRGALGQQLSVNGLFSI